MNTKLSLAEQVALNDRVVILERMLKLANPVAALFLERMLENANATLAGRAPRDFGRIDIPF